MVSFTSNSEAQSINHLTTAERGGKGCTTIKDYQHINLCIIFTGRYWGRVLCDWSTHNEVLELMKTGSSQSIIIETNVDTNVDTTVDTSSLQNSWGFDWESITSDPAKFVENIRVSNNDLRSEPIEHLESSKHLWTSLFVLYSRPRITCLYRTPWSQKSTISWQTGIQSIRRKASKRKDIQIPNKGRRQTQGIQRSEHLPPRKTTISHPPENQKRNRNCPSQWEEYWIAQCPDGDEAPDCGHDEGC